VLSFPWKLGSFNNDVQCDNKYMLEYYGEKQNQKEKENFVYEFSWQKVHNATQTRPEFHYIYIIYQAVITNKVSLQQQRGLRNAYFPFKFIKIIRK
jgi:hypothetical protein